MAEQTQAEDETEEEQNDQNEEVEFEPSNFTIDELEEELSAVETEDQLEEVLSLERDNDDRAGAKAVITDRLEQIRGDVPEEDEEEESGDDDEEEDDGPQYVARLPNEEEDGKEAMKKIAAARMFGDILGVEREIMFGDTDDPNVDSWGTEDQIVLAESCMDRRNMVVWVQQIYHELVYHLTHGGDTGVPPEEPNDEFKVEYFDRLNETLSPYLDDMVLLRRHGVKKNLQENGYDYETMFN